MGSDKESQADITASATPEPGTTKATVYDCKYAIDPVRGNYGVRTNIYIHDYFLNVSFAKVSDYSNLELFIREENALNLGPRNIDFSGTEVSATNIREIDVSRAFAVQCREYHMAKQALTEKAPLIKTSYESYINQ